jgi:predicted transposase/invertase (TIGR01784 family)
LYILNNLKKLEDIPLSLRGKQEYERVFEIAEVGNLTPKEMNEYQQSLKIQRDNNATMSYARKEAIAEGKAEGRQEERAKAEEEKKEMARKLKAQAVSVTIIADATGLSLDEIKAL